MLEAKNNRRGARRRAGLMVGALLLAVVAGCSDSSESAQIPGTTPAITPAATPVAQDIYLLRCAGCHAPDGRGIVGPDIRPEKIADKYSAASELTVIIRYGAGDMPEFGSKLTAAEIDAVAAYVFAGFG